MVRGAEEFPETGHQRRYPLGFRWSDERRRQRLAGPRTAAFALILAVAGSPALCATALGDRATGMAPGTWAELVTTGFNGGAILETYGAGRYILQYTDDTVWDPIHQQILELGASHGNLSTECCLTKFVRYSATTNTWTPDGGLASPPLGYPSGLGHSYDHHAFNPATGIMYHRRYGTTSVMQYNTNTNQWGPTLTINTMGSVQVAGALEFFPEYGPQGSLILVDGDWGVHRYNIATSTWAKIANGNGGPDPRLTMGAYHNFGEYNAVHKVVVFGGGGGGTVSRKMYKLSSAGTITPLQDAPVQMGIVSTIVTVDPVSGKYLVFSTNSSYTDKRFYEYNVVTDTWTLLPSSQHPPFFTGVDGPIFGTVATPIAEHGVILFINYEFPPNSKVFLYKHASGTPPPPDTSAPTGVGNASPASGATGVSSSPTLAALNASDVTPPISYYFELYLGSSCSGSPVQTRAYGTPNSWNPASLSANTTYAWRNRARDSASTPNESAFGSCSSLTTAAVDTQAPSVPGSFTVMAASSSQINLGWSASTDNVGVTGYRIYRCQGTTCTPALLTTIGAATAHGDTGLAANTAYRYQVSAVDAVGNESSRTSIGSATTQAQSTGQGDFGTRCQSPGVVRCVGFDAASDITGTWGSNSGVLAGSQTSPVLATDFTASGASSLKFTIPSQSGAGAAGSYFTNFSPDLSVQFGPNSEFYIQWRQRFSSEFLNTFYTNGGGWKQQIIGTGDFAGCTPSTATSTLCPTSCTVMEVVTQNSQQRGFAQMYNSCFGSSSHGGYASLDEPCTATSCAGNPFWAYDFKLQNSRPAPYCLYTQGQSSPPGYFSPGTCFAYAANEWMTFQIGITTGPRGANGVANPNGDEFVNSRIQMWIARDGQPAVQVINRYPWHLSAGPAGEGNRFGKVWLLPYHTNKDAAQVHPTAYTWYDELIISTQRIPDPGGSAPANPPSPPTNLHAN